VADGGTSDVEATSAPFVATGPSRDYATACLAALEATQALLHEAEERLGRMDAIAGDGDHGRGMVRGIDAATAAASAALGQGAGAGDVLASAGDAWADKAGGTSGVLWGAGLRAFGEAVGNSAAPEPGQLAAAVRAFADRIVQLGKAETGDKTMVDALLPFASSFAGLVAAGAKPARAWGDAARDATAAAEATAGLLPLKGRARPLAEKSLGTPDPGATSLAMIFTIMGPHLTAAASRETVGVRQ
jgi:dihydroxyacetone kinase